LKSKKANWPPGQKKLKPKAESGGGLLGQGPVARAQPRKQTLFEHENRLKMRILSIKFVSFIAQIL